MNKFTLLSILAIIATAAYCYKIQAGSKGLSNFAQQVPVSSAPRVIKAMPANTHTLSSKKNKKIVSI